MFTTLVHGFVKKVNVYYGGKSNSGLSSVLSGVGIFVGVFSGVGIFVGVFSSASGVGNVLGNLNLAVLRGTNFHEFLDIRLLGARHIVGSSTVVGDIKTNFFLKRIDTEHSQDIQDDE